jgi:hypothetical protein
LPSEQDLDAENAALEAEAIERERDEELRARDEQRREDEAVDDWRGAND